MAKNILMDSHIIKLIDDYRAIGNPVREIYINLITSGREDVTPNKITEELISNVVCKNKRTCDVCNRKFYRAHLRTTVATELCNLDGCEPPPPAVFTNKCDLDELERDEAVIEYYNPITQMTKYYLNGATCYHRGSLDDTKSYLEEKLKKRLATVWQKKGTYRNWSIVLS